MAPKQMSWKEIQKAKKEIYDYEAEVTQYTAQREKLLENLKADPENASFIQQKKDYDDIIREFTKEISDIRATLPAEEPKEEPVAPKKPKPEAKEIKVGDFVLAHRENEPRMTAAKVISITGSGANLVYQIRYKDKFFTQVRADETRPATKANEDQERKKRKAEEEAAMNNNPNVIMAGPQLNPSFTGANDRPTKAPRKLGSEKKLEKARSNWQDWNSKSKNANKKDSMFRTGDSLTARVGFLGSGRPMTQETKRSKHKFEQIEED